MVAEHYKFQDQGAPVLKATLLFKEHEAWARYLFCPQRESWPAWTNVLHDSPGSPTPDLGAWPGEHHYHFTGKEMEASKRTDRPPPLSSTGGEQQPSEKNLSIRTFSKFLQVLRTHCIVGSWINRAELGSLCDESVESPCSEFYDYFD